MQHNKTIVKDHRRKFSDEVEAEIIERYISGTRTGVLAKEYSADKKTITEMAKRHGHADYVSKNKGGITGTNTEHLNPRIFELHSQGLSQLAIGNAVGISQAVVSRVLRNSGLKANNPAKDQSGSKNNQWKGGRHITGEGYVGILTNEFPTMVNKQGYIPEHRFVMAQYMERPLYDWETVHHIDGNKQNNELENLQLRIGKHGKHEAYICMDCGSTRIEPTKLKERTED